MTSELRVRNQSQQLYVRALSATWRNGVQLHDPSLWLLKHPEMEEQMLRDADIKSAIQMRRHMIAGKHWQLTARRKDSPRAPLAVAVGTELLNEIKHFTTARLNLARSFFSGSRFAKIHGVNKLLTIGGVERVWWVPTRIEDLDKRMFRIVPQNDGAGNVSAHWEQWNIGTNRFEVETVASAKTTIRHVYQDDQASLGHGRGLREAIAWWWYAKEHVFMETLQAVERFAQGVISAKVDGVRDAATGEPNQDLIRAWTDVLEDMRARHVLVYDSADTVETIQMNGEGWNLLKDIREELKQTITTLILGANLPTTATEGGSYALGGIQQDSTEMLIQFDRHVMDNTLTDDLIGAVWWKNHPNMVALGLVDEKPLFVSTQETVQDPLERTQVFQGLNSMGVPVPQSEVYDQTGVRAPEPGEAVFEGATAPPPMPGFPQPGGLPMKHDA